MSTPNSPSSISFPDTESHFSSEVPTVHMPHHERQMVDEQMLRRRYFLSDYEKYNPVQNIQMLANHVFGLTEGILKLDNNYAGSRRMLDFVSNNQREVDASVRAVGTDLGMLDRKMSEDINFLRSEMHSIRLETQQGIQDIRRETQQGIQELKELLTMIAVRG